MVDNMTSLGFDFDKAAAELKETKTAEAEHMPEPYQEAEQLQESYTQSVSYTQMYNPTK